MVPQMIRYTPDVFGFPDRLLTRLRYHETLSFTSTLGALGTYAFRWNSTFDPNLTGTGHQPLYRDTYASIYDQYAVVSARATIRMVNATASTWTVGIGTDDDGSFAAGMDTASEMSHGKVSFLTPLSGSKSFMIFTENWDCKSRLGIDPYTSQLYKTAVGSNPTEGSTLTLYGVDQIGPASSVMNFEITLEQTVLWTELTTPTQS